MPPRRIFAIASTPTSYFSSGYFHFTQISEDRWICCRTVIPSQPLTSDNGYEVPVIFHMLAYINPYECFLTRRGDGPYFGQEASNNFRGCMASCWLSPCNSPQSRRDWRRMQRNIFTLRAHTAAELRIPFIFRPSPVQYLWSMQVGGDYYEGQEP
ncbi:hypothetical protein QCA50_003156 [Cerrena zonata]|uniref:Uncharacterized protein n=1 Tax=Cerrena zonata TaxID=2478898 RepID=A0AAW0GNX2_9APHY